MTSAPLTLASSSRIRPSMKPCRSLAAWYSAFSERSPWARASAMARMMAGTLDSLELLQLLLEPGVTFPGHRRALCHPSIPRVGVASAAR